jgi:hypothetical protein
LFFAGFRIDLLEVELRVEAEELRIGTEVVPRLAGARKQVEPLPLQRAQVLRVELQPRCGISELEVSLNSRLAQSLPDPDQVIVIDNRR